MPVIVIVFPGASLVPTLLFLLCFLLSASCFSRVAPLATSCSRLVNSVVSPVATAALSENNWAKRPLKSRFPVLTACAREDV